jgi:hypothetical protein
MAAYGHRHDRRHGGGPARGGGARGPRPSLAALLLLAAAALVVSACSKPIEKIKASDAGFFTVTMTGEQPPMKGANHVQLLILDDEGNRVDGAQLALAQEMTGMEHTVPFKPEITEKGKGLYDVTFHFTMEGHWKVNIWITTPDVQDTVSFDFPDVRK